MVHVCHVPFIPQWRFTPPSCSNQVCRVTSARALPEVGQSVGAQQRGREDLTGDTPAGLEASLVAELEVNPAQDAGAPRLGLGVRKALVAAGPVRRRVTREREADVVGAEEAAQYGRADPGE